MSPGHDDNNSRWWHFWTPRSWKHWWARRGPWREYRDRVRFLDSETAGNERRLSATNSDLARASQQLRWAGELTPGEVPVQTAKTETGLGSVSGVALLETRRREGVDLWVPVDHGTFHVTDRRGVFSGSKEVQFRLDKIESAIQTDHGLHIVVSTRKRSHVLSGPALQVEAMIVGARSVSAGASSTAPYEDVVSDLATAVDQIEQHLDELRGDRAALVAPARPLSPAWVPGAALILVLMFGSAMAPADTPAPDAAATTTTSPPATETTLPDPTTTIAPPSTTTAVATTTTTMTEDNLLAPVLAGSSGDPAATPPAGAEAVVVAAVTDGDTLKVTRADGSSESVRLIGINSPENGECFAAEATQALGVLTPVGTEIAATADVSDRDQNGRLLRYLWVGGFSVNEELVRRGAAIARRYEPDTALADRFERAQTEAQDDERGVWAPDACGPASDAYLRTVDVNYDAPGDDNQNLNEEWVVIRNEGDAPVDLTGWSVKDESATHRFLFPAAFVLAAGETVIIRTGCGDPLGTELFWCEVGSAVWNNDGDTVFILDPNGNTHDSYTYAPPTTTTSSTTTSTPRTTTTADRDCDPSYPDVCIPPYPPDLNCGDISHRRFRVLPPDPHGFDGNDNDGLGCESG